jgi:hypothetical protein
MQTLAYKEPWSWKKMDPGRFAELAPGEVVAWKEDGIMEFIAVRCELVTVIFSRPLCTADGEIGRIADDDLLYKIYGANLRIRFAYRLGPGGEKRKGRYHKKTARLVSKPRQTDTIDIECSNLERTRFHTVRISRTRVEILDQPYDTAVLIPPGICYRIRNNSANTTASLMVFAQADPAVTEKEDTYFL